MSVKMDMKERRCSINSSDSTKKNAVYCGTKEASALFHLPILSDLFCHIRKRPTYSQLVHPLGSVLQRNSVVLCPPQTHTNMRTTFSQSQVSPHNSHILLHTTLKRISAITTPYTSPRTDLSG